MLTKVLAVQSNSLDLRRVSLIFNISPYGFVNVNPFEFNVAGEVIVYVSFTDILPNNRLIPEPLSVKFL